MFTTNTVAPSPPDLPGFGRPLKTGRIAAVMSLILLVSALLSAPRAMAETFISHNASERTIIAMKAAKGSAQSTLPKGWVLAAPAKGPLAGAEIFLVFIENQRYADADGKAKFEGRFRGLAVAVPAKNKTTGKGGLMVTHLFVSDGNINPYSNSVPSEITHTISKRGVGNAPLEIRETWEITPSTGGKILLEVSFPRGLPKVVSATRDIYSNVQPDFYRIYKYSQFMDMVYSAPAGVNRGRNAKLEIEVPALSAMFNGTEEMIAVVNLPWYWRETWLP